MRWLCLGCAALVGLAGCTEFAFVLRPPPFFLGVESWTDVPEGQGTIRAKVGDVLHLPLGPSARADGLPVLYSVSVNGVVVDKPECSTSAKVTTYVFRCLSAGRYHIEDQPLDGRAARVWDVTVTE